MFSFHFAHSGKKHTLPVGETHAIPRDAGFRDTPAADLLSLVAEIDAGRPWRDAVRARYAVDNPWLHRIVTDPRRTAFFEDVLPPGEGPALDIGAGWGQTCRPLAARRAVLALEPVPERLAFVRAAARQDGVAANLACLGADYLDVEFETKFAAICVIGVLEWVGAFQDHADPQQRQAAFLRKIRTDLAPDGSLVLGIENRLGLKYLLGCPDDHLGEPYIASRPATLARRRWRESSGRILQSFTYSLPEMERMLHEAGFSEVDFFGAFPDYKLPEKIVPLAGSQLTSWLATAAVPAEHNGYNGHPLDATFQEFLVTQYRGLATAGNARHFVPSFFVRAR
ncbi:MAG TPA: class I SAM-dependent methyltransferase [Lacunisphaera sp.]|nr:class I SAM-dependent methyltransferase [Lacunisphaera sp.]